MRNNSSTDTYSKITSFFAINITDKNITDLKISFAMDNIPIGNYGLLNMFQIPNIFICFFTVGSKIFWKITAIPKSLIQFIFCQII